MTQLYLPMVHTWCLRGGVPRCDLADVVQDVFSAVAQSLDRFRQDHEDASFRGWLHGITRHKVLDYWRDRPVEGRASGGSDVHKQLANLKDPFGNEDESEKLSDAALLVKRALERISAEFELATWRAFERTALEGGSPREVADQLAMTIAAVYKARSRVLRRLRETLGDLDH